MKPGARCVVPASAARPRQHDSADDQRVVREVERVHELVEQRPSRLRQRDRGNDAKSARSTAYKWDSNQYGACGLVAFIVSQTSSKNGVSRSAGYVYRRNRSTALVLATRRGSAARGD